MDEFVDNTRGGLLRGEVGQALNSGLFEGRILCEKLRLNPDRTRFEDNEALAELCLQIEGWWEAHGKKIMNQLRDHDDDNRYQRLGNSIMPYAELLLRQTRFKVMAEAIQVVTIGSGHSKVKDKNIIGPDLGKSVATGGQPFSEKGDSKNSGEDGETKDPKKEHPEHRPGITYGSHGRHRTEVKGSSTGLRFNFVQMENIKIPFAFEPNTGTLVFNLDHPDWATCEENDSSLLRYQMAIITMVFSLELFRSDRNPVNSEIMEFAYANLHEQVFTIMNGEAMLKK
jgi:hypothetical protein